MHFGDFWSATFSQSWNTMWDLVIGEKGGRIVFIFLIEVLVIYAKDRRKSEPWKKGLIDGVWTVLITISVFLAAVAINGIWIEPPKRFVQLKDQPKKQDHAQTQPETPAPFTGSQASNVLKEIQKTASESVRKSENAVIEMMSKGGPAVLKEAAERTIVLPDIPAPKSEIDLSSVDEVSSAVGGILTKEAAKAALIKMNTPPEPAVLRMCEPIVDSHVAVFVNALKKLAEENGDILHSDYTNAAILAAGADSATVRLEKNEPWRFRIIFRRVGDKSYHWHIDGPQDFTCHFDGPNYNYWLNAGVTGTEKQGSGDTESLMKTNLFDIVTWMIGIHKAKHPMTNFTVNVKP